MKRTLAVIALLAGATLAAYAAVPRPTAVAPPTADQLGLSGNYAQAWNELRSQTIALHADVLEVAQQELSGLQALLATDAPNLDTFVQSAQAKADDLRVQSRALTARKLALYDSLPTAQQATVRAQLQKRLERLAHLRAALSELEAAAP